MVNVVVDGIPRGLKFPKFLTFFKRVILQTDREIHVNYVQPVMETGQKKISFSLKPTEARKAKRLLDGYPFMYAQKEYPLICFSEEDNVESSYNVPHEEPQSRDRRYVKNFEPPQKSQRYSNSPVRSETHSSYSNELQEIELKIQLVKKQRTLMEEETKLLLEKRKLEYLQNFGSNDFANLSNFEKICTRNNAVEISEFVGAAQYAQTAQTAQKKQQLSPAMIPSFLGPCKEIIAQMVPAINVHSEVNTENRSMLFNMLRASLKRRLAVVVEGQDFMPTRKIVSLYRTHHPKSTDNELLDELCNTIKTSWWPKTNKLKRPYPTEVDNERQSKVAKKPDTDTQLNQSEEKLTTYDSQYVDLDEFVDMDNDVENWVDDDDDWDELTKAEHVHDLTNAENDDELTNAEIADVLNNTKNVDELTNAENVDDLTNAEKVDDLTDVENVDELTKAENVDNELNNAEVCEELNETDNKAIQPIVEGKNDSEAQIHEDDETGNKNDDVNGSGNPDDGVNLKNDDAKKDECTKNDVEQVDDAGESKLIVDVDKPNQERADDEICQSKEQ